jgi:hypothetical protein
MLEKIVSGGQTGADRAALDWALCHGLMYGGWCPQGRWAEDGPLSPHYHLTETPSPDPGQRTAWNVRDSDATVLFSINSALSGGSRLTAEVAQSLGRPLLHLSRARPAVEAASLLTDFLTGHSVRILNVAGPRASEEPSVAAFVTEMLDWLKSPCWHDSCKQIM